MHGKFPAAQWVEHCTANAVRVRMEILYRGTCRFVLFFLFSGFFNITFFEASLLFPFYTWPINSLEYLCILLLSVNYISQGFLPLICKFTLSCTLKLTTCIAMLLNLSIIKSNNKAFLVIPI